MKRYPEYKDSGAKWVEEVPKHWDKVRLKFCSDLINGYAFKSDSYVDDGIPIVRIGDIKPDMDLIDAKKVPYEFFDTCHPFRIQFGDVLLALTGATIGKSTVYRLKDDALLNQRVAIIRPKQSITDGFLKHSIQSHLFKKHIDYECAGGAQDNIGKPEIGGYLTILPPTPEQKHIANYLDHKTQQIDTLTQKKQKQIDLLKEQRTAIINQAVTKGLNPDVKMKDSGIEWLGEIPEHWKVVKSKWVFRLFNGYAFKGEYFSKENNTAPTLITPGNFNPDGGLYFVEGKTTQYLGEYPKEFLLEKDDLVTVMTDLSYKNLILGRTEFIPDKGFLLNQRIAKLIINESYIQRINRHFLRYLLNTDLYREQLISYTTGATVNHTSPTKIRDRLCLVPPQNEQDEIVKYIDLKEKICRVLLNNIQFQINKLNEYRTTLTSEAVTGKIDVRDEVIP